MSGNRELLFRSHNAIDLQRGQQGALECLGRHGKFKSRALRSVRDGKGLKLTVYKFQSSDYHQAIFT
jgi:hypothetical protein